MQDIVFGKERVRAWPKPRGKPKTAAAKERQDRFRIVQKAASYFAPNALAYIHRATAGSPLLVRDVVTMQLYNRWFAFTLEDERTLWPMPALNDVSDALDVLGSTIGSSLIRTAEGWRAAPVVSRPPFAGCRLGYGNAALNSGGGFVIPWNTEEFDTGGFHDNAVNPTRFTIPAGVSFVELGMGAQTFAMAAGTLSRIWARKNGAGHLPMGGGTIGGAIGTTCGGNSGPLACVAGDYFDIVFQSNDSSHEFYAAGWLKVLG